MTNLYYSKNNISWTTAKIKLTEDPDNIVKPLEESLLNEDIIDAAYYENPFSPYEKIWGVIGKNGAILKSDSRINVEGEFNFIDYQAKVWNEVKLKLWRYKN
jgi:hypothetical protein